MRSNYGSSSATERVRVVIPAQAGIQEASAGARPESPWIPGLALLARNDEAINSLHISCALCLESLPHLLKLGAKKLWLDYDEEVDVLYVSFRRPQQATDSGMEDDLIYHYRNEEMGDIFIAREGQSALSLYIDFFSRNRDGKSIGMIEVTL